MPRESTKAGNYRINSRLNSVISVRGERPPQCWVSCIQCWSTPSESNSQPLDRPGLAPIAPSSRQLLFKGAQSSRYSPTPRRLRSSQAHEHPHCPLGAPPTHPQLLPPFSPASHWPDAVSETASVYPGRDPFQATLFPPPSADSEVPAPLFPSQMLNTPLGVEDPAGTSYPASA